MSVNMSMSCYLWSLGHESWLHAVFPIHIVLAVLVCNLLIYCVRLQSISHVNQNEMSKSIENTKINYKYFYLSS